jgi:hypothetical protein
LPRPNIRRSRSGRRPGAADADHWCPIIASITSCRRRSWARREDGRAAADRRGRFIRDDRDKLKDIAKPGLGLVRPSIRKSIRFETSLVNNLLELGDLVVGVGDPEIEGNGQIGNINSVVTLIRISSPLGEDAEPPPPTIEYQTEFGELDVLQLVPRVHQR